MGELCNNLNEIKGRLIDLYNLMIYNARNNKPTHPLIYAKFIQNIIDDFADNTAFVMINERLRYIIKRIYSHIEFNAHNMESFYCEEISAIVAALDEIIKVQPVWSAK